MCDLRLNPGYGCCLRQLDDSALKLDKGQILEEDRYHGCLWQISSQNLWRCPDTLLLLKMLPQDTDSWLTVGKWGCFSHY